MLIKKGDTTRWPEDNRYLIGEFWANGGGFTGGSLILDERIMKGIAIISKYYGCKLIITSTTRTPSYNLKEGGAEHSNHLKGWAIDFSARSVKKLVNVVIGNDVKKMTVHSALQYEIENRGELFHLLVEAGIRQFILYKTFFHIGLRDLLSIIDKRSVKKDAFVVKMEAELKAKISQAPSKDYYEYLHQDSSVNTVDKFINQDNSPALYFKGNIKGFLGYRDNLKRIWMTYDQAEKSKYSPEYKSLTAKIKENKDNSKLISDRNALTLVYSPSKELLLKSGTLLSIPKNKANIEVFATTGKDFFMVQQDLATFQYNEFKALINDPSYIKQETVRGNTSVVNFNHVSFSCWIYSRALDKIVNVSPFLRSIDTSVSSNGGTFSLSFNDISSLEEVYNNAGGYFNYFNKVTGGKYNLSFFTKYLQQNDIVWIRFEELRVEDRENEKLDLIIDKSQLPEKIYDLIGLIDNSSEAYYTRSNVPNINVSGRDLKKLIIEDGSYFIPFALVNGGKDFFLNYNEEDKVFKRLFAGGDFMNLFTALYRSIRDSLGFVFNQLTNVGILPKGVDLFSAYKNSLNRHTGNNEDRVSKVLELSVSDKEKLAERPTEGIWQIVKLLVDHQLDDRRLQNGELSHPDGPILGIIDKICQQPFVEFWGDTMGDQYVFIARQAPFTKSQIRDYFKNNEVITITADQVDSFTLNWEEQYYSWYQINPLSGLYGSDQFLAGTAMPVVYFEEFARMYGVHKKVISDNYISSYVLNGDKGNDNVNLYRKSLANDMKYVIESNAVLPFTRRGTIQIIGGDRRIKKNSWVYFEPTNEIFYVDIVSNHCGVMGENISRSTSLNVQRGMVRDYVLDAPIHKLDGKNIKANYFDIVNIDVIVEKLQVSLTEKGSKSSETSTNQKLVNDKMFKFFYRREQFNGKG